MNINALIFSLIFSFSCFSQEIRLNGITFTKGGQALPFVNIKSTKNPIGTISNSNGCYELNIPEILKNDTLEFFRMGYKKILLPVSKIEQDKNIVILEEDITKLEEVTVRSVKTEHIVYGSIAKKYSYSVWASTVAGAELGVKIKINKPTYINSIKMLILKNDCDTVFLRMNMYSFKGNSIGENMITKDHIAVIPQSIKGKRVGNIVFNFAGDVLLKDNVLFSFQYIDTKGCKSDKGLVMPAIHLNKTYFKKNLMSDWKISSLFGPVIIIDGDEIVE